MILKFNIHEKNLLLNTINKRFKSRNKNDDMKKADMIEEIQKQLEVSLETIKEQKKIIKKLNKSIIEMKIRVSESKQIKLY